MFFPEEPSAKKRDSKSSQQNDGISIPTAICLMERSVELCFFEWENNFPAEYCINQSNLWDYRFIELGF